MKGNHTIRYIGNEDVARRFLIQRQDGKLFTGRGWTERLDEARLYDKLDTVQKVFRDLQNRQCRGKPKRQFTLQLDLIVWGAEGFSIDDLRRFLAQALHLNIDNAASGDGPNGTCVMAAPALGSLREVDSEIESRNTN